MCAVAKRFLGRRAATAKRHSRFDRELIAVAVFQFHFALHNVRTVLDCLDCYLSHVPTMSCRPKWRHLQIFLSRNSKRFLDSARNGQRGLPAPPPVRITAMRTAAADRASATGG